MVLWYTHARLDIGADSNSWWAHMAIVGALISGLLWGCGPFVFSPLDDAHLLFVALVVGGMCAGAATVHAAYFPLVVAFILPAILPLAVYFFMQGGRLQIVAGVMASVFGMSLCIASLKFSRWFGDTTLARLALAGRTLELDEANRRLTTEISSHRSTEAKLQHSQKLESVGRLTAGIAHDFNNLLMAIGGSAGLIAMHLASNSACAPHIRTVLQSVERGSTLTQRLLAFGRQQTLVPRSVDINDVLRDMEELLLTTLGGYGRLSLQLDREPVVAFVDPTQLEHAILNLVINAQDAMPNGGWVTIKTAHLTLRGSEAGTEGLIGEFVLVSVSDTGTGMPESVRLRAFDPFFTTKEMGKGSGLGLSQVYGMVHQSGGATKIDSQPGMGTTVSIYLPQGSKEAVPARAQDARAVTCSDVSPTQRHILLLDDDQQVRETVAAILSTAGYSVQSYAAASEALDEVNGPHSIDLMVVDFAMPDMRGDQFAVKARLQRATVPIVFITGYSEPASLQSEPWVLQKPFAAASLIQTVEQAMQVVA